MPTAEETYAALHVLRAERGRGAPGSREALAVVRDALAELAAAEVRRTEDVREEIAQLAWIKVYRRVESLEASEPLGAVAWLRTIVRNLARDAHRARERARVVRSLDAPGRDEGRPLHEVVAAAPSEPAALADPALLVPHEEALWDYVYGWVARSGMRATAVQPAFANATIAYGNVVRGWSTAEIRERLGVDAEDNAIQQRASRGRTKVLLPAVEAWLEGLSEEDEERRAFAETLRGLLKEKARADAGKPRPERRRGGDEGPPVSPTEDCTSDQCDGEGDHG